MNLKDPGSLDVLVVFVVVLVTILLILKYRTRAQLPPIPPGPSPRPIIGNVEYMGHGNQLEAFRQLRSKYGDIFSLKFGRKLYIVVNGYDTLREAFVKHGDVLSDRPDTYSWILLSKGRGLSGSSGEIWKKTRAFTIGTLRNFGFGKKSLEDRISEEVATFLEDMNMTNGQPFDVRNMAMTSVANVICSIVFGRRFDYQDGAFQNLLDLLDENFHLVGYIGILNVFPLLRFLPGDRFGVKKLIRNIGKLRNFFQAEICRHREQFDNQYVYDFIDAFLVEEKEHGENKDPMFTDANLTTLISNLFSAGIETTSTAIRWCIIYLLRFPKVQDELLQEIDSVVGGSRRPMLKDRVAMPFCESFINEVLRIANIAPFAVPHAAAQDIILNGFLIPKGSVLIPNLDSVTSDPNLFQSPCKFDPKRFVGSDGKLEGFEKVSAFSIGRRVCPGEALARMELFLFITALVQKFELKPDDATGLPEAEGILGITLSPKPFKFCALERDVVFVH